MKLRFTPHSVRLRLNQLEVVKFALEGKLAEQIDFPGPAQHCAYLQFAGRERAGIRIGTL